jgi:probable FeS assembly SUF system protein SufT
MQKTESISLIRSCLAFAIPSGQPVILAKKAEVELVQALGGSFTVKLRGQLYRIDNKHADALGREPVVPTSPPLQITDENVTEMLWEQMKTCFDPEIPINIVDLGLVYKCEAEQTERGARRARVEMTLTAPTCGMGKILIEDVRLRLLEVPTIEEATVELVFDPPWDISRMSETARLQTGLL